MCKYIESGEDCYFGDKCRYAHTEQQLETMKEEQKNRPRFVKGAQNPEGFLTNAQGGKFLGSQNSNTVKPNWNTNNTQKKFPCKFFQTDACRFGDKCRFLHVKSSDVDRDDDEEFHSYKTRGKKPEAKTDPTKKPFPTLPSDNKFDEEENQPDSGENIENVENVEKEIPEMVDTPCDDDQHLLKKQSSDCTEFFNNKNSFEM